MPTLIFRNPREIDFDNYKTLTPVHHEQMAISARLGFGKKFSTPEDLLKQSEEYVQLYDVVDAEQPDIVLYDAWVYLADTANVFHHGTAKDTGVGMIQFGFECLTDKPSPECEQLAEDIQVAFDAIAYDMDTEDED